MKTSIAFIVIMSLFSLQVNAQTSEIDSLKQEIQTLKTQLAPINSLSNSDLRDWGRGWYTLGTSGATYQFGLELGYMWKAYDDKDQPESDNIIGKNNAYRYGISFGADYFLNENVWKNGSLIDSDGYMFYSKLNAASPLYLNILSFAGHLKFAYAKAFTNNKHGFDDARFVFGYGFDVEFRTSQKEQITIGFTDASDSFFSNRKDTIFPQKVRFVFGFKRFF
ncbi:hypothetical protein EP331_06195 [bacterium]|nr:MAG: hypothetical protein EP331_06195 [bacterium]